MDIILRPARKTDSYKIAQLIDIANFNIKSKALADAAIDGETPMETGARLVAKTDHDYNYLNTIVAEKNGVFLGISLAFPIPPISQDEMNKKDGLSLIYEQLRQHAIGDYYIDTLACFPSFRGEGIGTKLLKDAEIRAKQNKHKNLCLLAFEANAGAVRLYKRFGLTEVTRLSPPDLPDIPFGGDVLLLSKSLRD